MKPMNSNLPGDDDLFAEIRRLMRYEPETGHFIRITDHKRGRAGERAGSIHHDGRVFIGLLGYRFLAHRLAVLWMTGRMPEFEVDHINCDHSDNRWSNLRECTSSQNKWNQRCSISNSTGVKGVHYQKRYNTYAARFKKDRKTIYLGTFKTVEAARDALEHARPSEHGEFSRN